MAATTFDADIKTLTREIYTIGNGLSEQAILSPEIGKKLLAASSKLTAVLETPTQHVHKIMFQVRPLDTKNFVEDF